MPFSPPQFDNAGDEIYDYQVLGDVITLSGVGTVVDNNNNQINFYYYPYDLSGNLQLYFVQVYNSLGVLQFTKEGWPDTFETDSPGASSNGNSDNQISNPQFAVVNFSPNTSTTISLSGTGPTTVAIAPDWNLVIGYSGTSSVIVAQNPVLGSSNIVTNPPYTLTVTPSGGITSLSLVQTLNNNPGIWANSYVAANIVLGANAPTTTISYNPSSGLTTSIPLLSTANSSGITAQFSNTVLLPASVNTTTPPGNASIVITLDITLPTTLTSVQVLTLSGNVTGIVYEQETVNRQIDHLFNYYNSLLQYKPIPSYLVGWDFPLNPAQFLGASVAAQAVGANKSYYAWDQTILFQSANSGITTSRDATGCLKTLSAPSGGTQLALIQYLPAAQAIEMLSRRKCVNISANASVSTVATVSLWYTKSTLPSTIGSNNSLVLTLDANGYPATQNGTWVQVPRGGQGTSTLTNTATNAAQVTLGVAATAASFIQYPLNGWDMQGNTDINGATFFAIVVGTATLAQNAYILWQSISCQDGDIATVPAPKTLNVALQDCQNYYWKTFNQNVVPANGAGYAGALGYYGQNAAGDNYTFPVAFPTVMNTSPSMTFYNPVSNNAKWYNRTAAADSGTAAADFSLSPRGTGVTNPQVGADGVNTFMAVHATADARLGQ